jgi:hypothetical protein
VYRLAGQLAASTSARTWSTPADPGRVNIFERWESQAALEIFRSSGPDTEQRRAMLTVSVQEYDIRAGGVRVGCGRNRPDGLCCDR